MSTIIETPRLIIREIHLTDINEMFELHADPEVHTYLGNETVTCKEQIIDIIKFVRQQYLDRGVGRWAIIRKETNEFVGWTGLEFVTTEINGHKNFYDLGYRLIKRFWRQGIATETAWASLDYAFNKLNATEVYAMADCRNEGSNKILTRVGLSLIETFDYHGVEHNWYKIRRMEHQNENVSRSGYR